MKQNEILTFETKAELAAALENGPLVPDHRIWNDIKRCYFDETANGCPFQIEDALGNRDDMAGNIWTYKRWRKYPAEPPKPRRWSEDVDEDDSMGFYTFDNGWYIDGIMSRKNGIGIEVAEAPGRIFTSIPFLRASGMIGCYDVVRLDMVKCTPVRVWFEAAE